LWLAGGGIRGLIAPIRGPATWLVGGGMDLDHVHGSGDGVDVSRQGTADRLAVAATSVLTWPLSGRLLLRGGADVVVPLRRQKFVLEGIGEVGRPAPVAVRGLFGIEVRF
jgi:hypothetical protein